MIIAVFYPKGRAEGQVFSGKPVRSGHKKRPGRGGLYNLVDGGRGWD